MLRPHPDMTEWEYARAEKLWVSDAEDADDLIVVDEEDE